MKNVGYSQMLANHHLNINLAIIKDLRERLEKYKEVNTLIILVLVIISYNKRNITELTAEKLAEELDMTRPSVEKYLKILNVEGILSIKSYKKKEVIKHLQGYDID